MISRSGLEGHTARRNHRLLRAARPFAGSLAQGQAQGIKSCAAFIGTGRAASCCLVASDADVRPLDQCHIDIRRITSQIQSAPSTHLRHVGCTSSQHRQRDRQDSNNPASTVRHILFRFPRCARSDFPSTSWQCASGHTFVRKLPSFGRQFECHDEFAPDAAALPGPAVSIISSMISL